MLYLIGLGIGGIGDITIKGAEYLKKSNIIFMEEYTCPLNIDLKELERLAGKKITVLDRKGTEEGGIIVKNALEKNVAFLVGGDPLSATTHKELLIEAKKKGIEFEVVHSSSIFSAVAECGLELYNFGKTVSLPFFVKNFAPASPYEDIEKNLSNHLHTLLLLDVGMDIETAMKQLLELESRIKHNLFTQRTKLIVLKDIGSVDSSIKYSSIGTLRTFFPQKSKIALFCLVIPAKLNFKEKEYLTEIIE